MAEDKQQAEDKDNVQRPYKGLVTDMSPADQPKDTYRYALNAVNKTDSGNTNFLSIEKAIEACTQFPAGTKMIQSIYMVDDLSAVFLTDDYYSYIGTVDKFSVFKLYVKTTVLGLSDKYPISGTFRIRRNFSKIIYWVDGEHRPRLFNFDRVSDFYSPEYNAWLSSPIGTFTGEMWSDIKFDLIKTYSTIPIFTGVEILSSGNTPSGSYSCAIQLVDENLSVTEWITTSNPVPIYNDSLSSKYSEIRGSRNSSSYAQNFPNASKSIKWSFGNFDENFPFYRIAVIVANTNSGEVNKVLVSKLMPTSDPKFTYSGNDLDFTLTPLSDIEQTKIDISSAKYIEQLENRVILAGIKGKQINWCDFQQNASKIKSTLAGKHVVADSVEAIGNPKNPQSSFELTGYMWGEVYSFGIVYIFNDGYKSPVYHIPGRIESDTNTGMDFYECEDSPYIDIHGCTVKDYWGVNGYDGTNLLGKNIRHHKFPRRKSKLFIENDTLVNLVVYKLMAVSLTLGVNGIVYHGTVTIKDNTGNVLSETIILVPADYVDGTWIELGYFVDINNPVIDTVVLTGTTDFTFATAYNLQYVNNNYKSTSNDLCGIKFTNIERPHQDVIGFEIVRNERTEDDKIVIDNALVGPITHSTTDISNPYHTFGLLTPEVSPDKLSPKGVYIFSPEHQFKNRKITFDSFDVIGTYTRSSKVFSTEIDDNTLSTQGGLIKLLVHNDGAGLYIQDVRPGTTFNASYNKGDDPDGFDLQVLYRSNGFIYESLSANELTLANPKKLYYLSAAGSANSDDMILFNTCIDNKIILSTFDQDIYSSVLFSSNGTPRLLYVSLLKDNKIAYNNFINRTYYKEMNNPVFFGDNNVVSTNDIFNGDSYTAPMTVCASTYFDTKFADRAKKSRVWKIIVGGVLIVAGVAGLIFSGGLSAGLIAAGLATIATAALVVTAVTVMAVSYGVSMLTSGIEFETMKNMIDQHYEAGLKETIEDNDNIASNYKFSGTEDDRFEWFTDRVDNIYFESSINVSLRSGLTAPLSDYVNAPSTQPTNYLLTPSSTAPKESFEVYLTNKFTVIDREQNSGRLYLGYANAEFYDINLDYMRRNKEKPQFYLPIEYDCCSTRLEQFDNRIHYSEQAFQEEKADNYRSFLPNNYKDVEGQFGKITNIFRFANTLYVHTTESLLVIPQNLQERVNQELVTFIGTGEFFALPVRQVMDGENGSFGSSDNRATIVTRNGVFFVNTREGVPYMLVTKTASYTSMTLPEEVSAGNGIWFRANTRTQLHDYIKALLPDYEINNNIIDDNSVGIHAIFDTVINRIILTKIDYIPTVSLYIYDGTGQTGKLTYRLIDNKFYFNNIEITFSNTDFFENKSWTMSYSPDSKSWVSYHSYLPRIYMATQFGLYSSINSILYAHHVNGKFCKFYGKNYPHIIEYVSMSNPIATRTWDTVSIICNFMKYNSLYKQFLETNKFFDKIIFSNSRQSSGEISLVVRDSHIDSQNYLLNTIKNVTSVCVTEKIEGSWTINCIRDYVGDYTMPLFVSDWNSIKSSYPIDKVVNTLSINPNKQWFELENLRDKYLVIRLIFSNFEDADVQITTNYSIENEQQSLR